MAGNRERLAQPGEYPRPYRDYAMKRPYSTTAGIKQPGRSVAYSAIDGLEISSSFQDIHRNCNLRRYELFLCFGGVFQVGRVFRYGRTRFGN